MKTLLVYMPQMIVASGLFYGYYHFFLRNKKFHRYNRFYLLAIVLLSLIIPFFNIPVYFTKEAADDSVILQTLNAINLTETEETFSVVPSHIQPATSSFIWFSWQNIVYGLYAIVVLAFLIRILLSVRKIKIISASYPAEKIGDINFVNTNEPGTPFSFFRWLFWNKEIELNSDKGQQIFRHELFHIAQKHTLDIFFIEIITAAAWFNPFFHLIKKEIKTIHEFLADEYAMHKTESWQYAELLLMQALNTKLHLVNPFFHNQIKRRIAMITSSQKPGHQYLRKLLVLPVAAVIAALFAFSYKNRNAKDDSIVRSNETITIVVDAAHGGIDKGALSVDGKYTEAQLALEIAKTIQQWSSEYNINVVMTRDEDKLPGNVTTIKQGLDKRVEIVKNINPKAYISIHLNAFPLNKPTELTGFDFYVSADKYKGNSKSLAYHMMNEIEKVYTTRRNISPMENGSFYIFDHLNIPAVAVECGFINNSNDLNFIIDKSNQQKIARAILNAVSKFGNGYKSIFEDPAIDTPKNKLPDTLAWVRAANAGSLKKISPTAQQLKDWTNAAQYGVWIDAKKIKNSDLPKYNPTDFSWYNVSKLYGAAKKNVAYNYQVSLFSKKSDMEKLIDKAQKDWQDTTKMLMVVNNTIYSKIKKEDIDKVYPPHSIERITVLKDKAAIAKYGEIGRYGVIEVITKGPVEVRKTEVELFDTTKSNNSLKEVVVTGYPSQVANEPLFEKVETEPGFPGGEIAWRKYLEKNLNALVPTNNGAKAGSYKVEIKFLVDKEGDISSIKALSHHGFGMEEEVIRVIAKGPKWIPAKQNGNIVNAFKTQPVTFVIVEDEKDKKDPIITNDKKKGNDSHDFPKISLRDLQRVNPEYLLRVNLQEIISFRYSTDTKEGIINESVNTGKQFNEATKKMIKNAEPGNVIAIDEIWLMINGEKKKSPSVVYQVTN